MDFEFLVNAPMLHSLLLHCLPELEQRLAAVLLAFAHLRHWAQSKQAQIIGNRNRTLVTVQYHAAREGQL